MSSADQIQEIYNKMKEEIAKLKETKKKDKECILTEILRARQEIELLKVPTFIELAEDHIEEGMSVVIFVNFEQTIQALSERLKTRCIITGSIKNEEREKNIKEFQEGKQRIILCNSRAGGVGISLHDEYGNYPRISIISPTYSAQDLKQVLGRIHREGSKSKALQKIIFTSGTIEEEIAEKVQNKLDNITLINDGDLI
jgi:superfamily II DNA or RNA helicase